jgi:ankyrin repeat protein
MPDSYDKRFFDSPEDAFVAAGERSDRKTLGLLLADGVAIDCKDSRFGSSALHCAASMGSKRTVEFLLDHGADINALDGNDMTPLMCACSAGKKKGSAVALALIMRGANAVYCREADGMTAFMFALWGQCQNQVFEALKTAGAQPPEAGFPILRLR